MDINNTLNFLVSKLKCPTYIDKLSFHTSMRVGGRAVVIEPQTIDELLQIIKLLKINHFGYYVLGNGTNVVVSDKDCKFVIIKIANNMSKIQKYGENFICEAGASLYKIIGKAKKYNFGGMEALFGVPGTIGGAVVMNAGCYGKEIKDYVVWVEYLENGKVYRRYNKQLSFLYRQSIFQQKKVIITKVCLRLQSKQMSDIIQECKFYMDKRQSSQPLDKPSAGSVFRKIGDIPAPILIQQSGLKGVNVGGAQCSNKHCGFVVNDNNATFCDSIELIGLIQKTVQKIFGILLDIEIKLLGEEDEITRRLSYSYDQ